MKERRLWKITALVSLVLAFSALALSYVVAQIAQGGSPTQFAALNVVDNTGSSNAWKIVSGEEYGLNAHVGQGRVTFNQQSVSAANTAVSITLAAGGGGTTRNRISSVAAFCSAGTSTLTIESPAATTIYSLPSGSVGTSELRRDWSLPLSGANDAAMVVTLSACGAGNTGTLTVQADRF